MNAYKQLSLAAVAALGVVALSGQAFAVGTTADLPCTTAGYTTTYSTECTSTSFSASTVVTASQTVDAAASQTAGLIAGRIGAMSGGGTGAKMSSANGVTQYGYNLSLDEDGKAAGDGKGKIGLWAAGSYTKLDYNKSGSAFDGNMSSGLVGLDYQVTDKLLVGLSGGYERSSITTTFNTGTQKSTGWTVAPYVLFQANKTYSVDVSGGYSKLNYDVTRTEPLNTVSITGTTDAKRWFGAANVNGDWTSNKLEMGASLGVLQVQEKKDAFVESGTSGTQSVAAQTTDLGRAHLGGDLGYNLGVAVPYVSADVRYDYSTDAGDSSSVEVGLGSRFNLGKSVTAGIEVNSVQLQKDTKQYGATASLRAEF